MNGVKQQPGLPCHCSFYLSYKFDRGRPFWLGTHFHQLIYPTVLRTAHQSRLLGPTEELFCERVSDGSLFWNLRMSVVRGLVLSSIATSPNRTSPRGFKSAWLHLAFSSVFFAWSCFPGMSCWWVLFKKKSRRLKGDAVLSASLRSSLKYWAELESSCP